LLTNEGIVGDGGVKACRRNQASHPGISRIEGTNHSPPWLWFTALGGLQGMTQIREMRDKCDCLHTEQLFRASPAPVEPAISLQWIHDR